TPSRPMSLLTIYCASLPHLIFSALRLWCSRRLGLNGLAQSLRAGVRSKTLPGVLRCYSTDVATGETAKGTLASLSSPVHTTGLVGLLTLCPCSGRDASAPERPARRVL